MGRTSESGGIVHWCAPSRGMSSKCIAERVTTRLHLAFRYLARASVPIDNRRETRCSLRFKTPALMMCLLLLAPVAAAAPQKDVCGLPKDLQTLIAGSYPGQSVVNASDLSDDDKKSFQRDHGDSCPGLVNVDFYGDGKPTFAIALTTKVGTGNTTMLVLAHRIGADWKLRMLSKPDGPDATPYVWSAKPGEYESVYQHKVRATSPVIIFCGCPSWAILYAWTNNRIARLWLRD